MNEGAEAQPARALASILAGPLGTALVTAVFVGAGLASIAMGRGIESEGLVLARSSAAMWDAPLAILFFLRLRPLSSAFYALPSLFGTTAFCVAHLWVAASALPMLRAVAASFGQRATNLPGFFVAGSTAFLGSAITGGATSDGLVMVVAFLYCWRVRRWPIAAGVLLGLMPLVRPELGALAVILTVALGWAHARAPRDATRAAAQRHDGAMLASALSAGLLYAAAGALYQRDVIWFLHFPPNPPHGAWGRGGMDWAQELARIDLRSTLEELLVCTPFAPLAVAFALRAPKGPERALAFFLGFMLVLLTVLPRLGLFGGFGARYLVPILPLIALFAARLIEDVEAQRDRWALPSFVMAIVLSAASFLAIRHSLSPLALTYVALSLLGSAALGMRRGPFGALVLAQFSLGSLVVMLGLTPGLRDLSATQEVERWLAAERLPSAEHLVYTNDQLLPFLVNFERAEAADHVRFFFQEDITGTVAQLTNPANGQTEAALRALGRANPGETVDGGALTPSAMPVGSLLVYRDDPRLWVTLDEAAFRGHLRERARFGSMVVADVVASSP